MIYEKIISDIKIARKERNSHKVKLLTTLIGELQNISKMPGKSGIISDSDCTTVIKKFISNNDFIIEVSPESCINAKVEKTILSEYIKPDLSEDELIKIINKFKDEKSLNLTEGKSIGQIMNYLKQTYPGQYDGNKVTSIIKTYK